MKNTLKNMVIAALFSAVLPAQAAIVDYTFSGSIDDGFYTGQAFTGNFSFDDSSLTSSFSGVVNVSNINFNFLGTTFTESNFLVGANPTVAFDSGVFSGLEWSYDSINPIVNFTFVSATPNTPAFLTYGPAVGNAGAGNGTVNFYEVAAVPEPETYAMFLAGLGLMGFVARRKKNA